MVTKKGQLGNIQGLILTLVVVGVLIGAGFFVLAEFQDELDNNSVTVTNETGGFINSSGYTLAGASDTAANSFTITEARNSTGDVITSSDYTLDSSGVVTNTTSTTYTDVRFDYNYQRGESAYEGVNGTVEALDTVPNLLPLIVLIVMVVIILALVFTIPGARSAA